MQAEVYSKGIEILVSKNMNLVCKLYVVPGKEECAFQSPVLAGDIVIRGVGACKCWFTMLPGLFLPATAVKGGCSSPRSPCCPAVEP